MSVVAPNGIIRFLKDVPIDDTYENTLYFESKEAQTLYFTGLTPVHQMTEATRVRDGIIRVNGVADDFLMCNYLMFQNMNFSNKWFYAFIENVVYVNNATTEIVYRIDEVQTWLYEHDVNLLECLIARQHSETDEVGDNIVGENMGGNELVISRQLDALNFCTPDPDHFPTTGKLAIMNVCSYFEQDPDTGAYHPRASRVGITDGVANGAITYAYGYEDDDPAGLNAISDIIDRLTEEQLSESIVGGYILPVQLFGDFRSTQDPDYPDPDGEQQEKHFPFNVANAYTNLDTYEPKNKKLFTAPFNWIYAISSDGQNIPLQPQFLGNKNRVSFRCYHSVAGIPNARLILENYKGEAENSENYLSYCDFPQLQYSIDGYKAWVASGGEAKLELSLSQTQQAQSLVKQQAGYGLLSGLAHQGIGAAGDIMSAQDSKAGVTRETYAKLADRAVSMADTVASAYFTFAESEQTIQFANENADLIRTIARSLPSSMHGMASNTALLGGNNLSLKLEQRCVNRYIAKTIDDFFTMYGYAQNIVATPNLKARKEFTYIKTIGCKINGGAPSDSLTRLQAIFNTGIRFWVNPANVGRYTEIDNGVLTP